MMPGTSTVAELKRKIAFQLGFPIASAPSMRLRSTASLQENNRLGDLALHGNRLAIVVENGTDLSPKLAFDIGQILKHWLSPAFASRNSYRTALLALKDVANRVLTETMVSDFSSTLTIRTFSRVTRGFELLKKLGFTVTATSIHSAPGADLRLYQVVIDHVADLDPTVQPSTPGRRSVTRSTIASVQRRRRRLREMIEMGYEFLVRLENVRVRLEETVIEAMPLQTLNAASLAAMSENGQSECTICLEAFAVDDVIMRLPCLHTYHDRCASTWFQQSRRCPNDMLEVTMDCKRG
jgi:hypothetical protein